MHSGKERELVGAVVGWAEAIGHTYVRLEPARAHPMVVTQDGSGKTHEYTFGELRALARPDVAQATGPGPYLRSASLDQIINELERRATLVCPGCFGQPDAMTTCAACEGTGRAPWPEMVALVAELRANLLPF